MVTEKMGNTEHKEEDSFALYTEKNRTQAVREVPQTNPRGKVFCGG